MEFAYNDVTVQHLIKKITQWEILIILKFFNIHCLYESMYTVFWFKTMQKFYPK